LKYLDNLKSKAKSLKKELIVLYFAYRHPETGLWPKVILFLTLGYALSPIDLIPDKVLQECRIKAKKLPGNYFFAFVIVIIWGVIVLFCLKLIYMLL